MRQPERSAGSIKIHNKYKKKYKKTKKKAEIIIIKWKLNIKQTQAGVPIQTTEPSSCPPAPLQTPPSFPSSVCPLLLGASHHAAEKCSLICIMYILFCARLCVFVCLTSTSLLASTERSSLCVRSLLARLLVFSCFRPCC